MKKSTCLNCIKRFVGCHSNCDEYKEYKKELEIIKHNKNIDKFSRPIYNSKSRCY